ncbi:endoplasmic reticulum-Golgi intermediate [Sesbania bispinosa]|nr:endoplasmic reticulum-Golgi intermediate [Sesbania bispinosa]
MLKGRRSRQEKKHSTVKSSSSSSHSRLHGMQVRGRGVTADVKHLDKPKEDVLESGQGCNFFVGVRKKTCRNLEMRRVREAMS